MGLIAGIETVENNVSFDSSSKLKTTAIAAS